MRALSSTRADAGCRVCRHQATAVNDPPAPIRFGSAAGGPHHQRPAHAVPWVPIFFDLFTCFARPGRQRTRRILLGLPGAFTDAISGWIFPMSVAKLKLEASVNGSLSHAIKGFGTRTEYPQRQSAWPWRASRPQAECVGPDQHAGLGAGLGVNKSGVAGFPSGS